MPRALLALISLTTAATLSVQGQKWTPEQQEVIDAAKACYDIWANAFAEQRSVDAFLEGCTAGDWVFWNTGEGSLETDEQLRRWWDLIGYPRGVKPNWVAVKPLDVKVRGNVGLLYGYGRDTWQEPGQIEENETKVLFVYHREDGTYRLIGGMLVPVSSRIWQMP
jgi:hypothetical protein